MRPLTRTSETDTSPLTFDTTSTPPMSPVNASAATSGYRPKICQVWNTLIPIFPRQLITISRPTPRDTRQKVFSAPAESTLDVLHTEPNSRERRVSRTNPRRGARLRRPRRVASEHARRTDVSIGPAREVPAPPPARDVRTCLAHDFTSERPYMFRPRHRMPSPHPLPQCAQPPFRMRPPFHAPSPLRARRRRPGAAPRTCSRTLHDPPRRRKMRFHCVIILKTPRSR